MFVNYMYDMIMVNNSPFVNKLVSQRQYGLFFNKKNQSLNLLIHHYKFTTIKLSQKTKILHVFFYWHFFPPKTENEITLFA